MGAPAGPPAGAGRGPPPAPATGRPAPAIPNRPGGQESIFSDQLQRGVNC